MSADAVAEVGAGEVVADVVVVGAGNAALTAALAAHEAGAPGEVVGGGAGTAAPPAALAAHEAGARVVVLEAAPKELRGGNSRFSGGIFRFAHGGLDHLRPILTEEGARWADSRPVT